MEFYSRAKEWVEFLKETENLAREILSVPNDFQVFLAPGGGTLQFEAIPWNLLGNKTKANYLNTGYWSRRAITEANYICQVHEVAKTQVRNGLTGIPSESEWSIDPDAGFLHYCDNETVEGLEYNFQPSRPKN